MSKIRFLSYAVMFCVATSAYCAQGHNENCKTHCDFISVLTQLIASGRDEEMRGDVATALAAYLADNPQCGNDPAVVDDIVRFVTDKNDAVKAGAAQALANIGPPAKAAIPTLERALRQAEEKMESNDSVMLPSLSVADVIRNALTRVKGNGVGG